MSSSSDGALPLADVLSRAASELDRQAAAVDAMHALAAGEGAATGAQALRAAQSVDTVAQHLRALAEVMAGLSAAVPAGTRAPASIVDAVPLSDLAARLRGEAAPGAEDDGAFELL